MEPITQIDPYIIDKEIKRRELYLAMLEDLISILKDTGMTNIYIKQLVLRYFYNKIAEITSSGTDSRKDPLMIQGRYKLSDKQILDDLVYSKQDPKRAEDIIELIESHVANANEVLPKLKYKKRIARKHKSQLIVDKLVVNDTRNLSKVNIDYAFALALRYQYIALDNHNLARLYQQDNFEKDCCLEGFGTAYNHYFDKFCSPFIDLEFIFGSIGSFFSIQEWPLKYIHINPPFDQELMSFAVYKVLNTIDTLSEGYTFHFVLPDWSDLKSFQDLVKSPFVTFWNVHKKGTFPFVDYHKDPKRLIYPCAILEVILESK